MKKTLILTAAAIPTGVIVGAVDALFGRVLLYLGAVRDAHTAWLLPFLGVVGALMAWAYKKYGAGCENGMGMVFEAGHADREDIPLQLVPFVMCATWLTHLFGGSAGREGVAVQLGAAISHRVGRLLRVEDAPRLMLITGISAGFSGLFRTPFAATAFAMEVLTVGRLEHRALLPAAVAALLQQRTEVLTDIPGKLGFFDALPEYGPELFENKKSKSTLESAKKFLALAAERLAALPSWDDESILEAMKSLAEAEGVKNAAVMWPVRIAASGQTVTPGGAVEICRILGRDETLRRLKVGLEKLG